MQNWSLILAGVFVLAIAFFSTSIDLNLTGQISQSSVEYGRFYPEELALNVEHAGCKWAQDHYEACAQIFWKSALPESYVKVFIAGGESLGESQKQSHSPTVYCQNVGLDSGFRAVQAYLYTPQAALKRVDVDTRITCDKDSEPTTKKVTKKYSLLIGTSDRVRNEGTQAFTGLGGKPVSCKVAGTWKTNNRERVGELRKFCHGATGSFDSSFEAGKSFVIDDPAAFDWMDLSAANDFDPQPTTYSGYLLYAPTCDQTGYKLGRYYARARVVSLDEDGFTVDWEYYNADTRPRVDFLFEATCAVETGETKKPKLTGQPVEEPVIELPTPESIVEEPVITVVEEKPKPLIFKFIDWLRLLF